MITLINIWNFNSTGHYKYNLAYVSYYLCKFGYNIKIINLWPDNLNTVYLLKIWEFYFENGKDYIDKIIDIHNYYPLIKPNKYLRNRIFRMKLIRKVLIELNKNSLKNEVFYFLDLPKPLALIPISLARKSIFYYHFDGDLEISQIKYLSFFNPFLRFSSKNILKKCLTINVGDSFMVKYIQSKWNISSEKIKVRPWTILDKNKIANKYYSNKEYNLGFVGNISFSKGIYIFIEALKLIKIFLLKNNINIIIAGHIQSEPSLEKYLYKEIASLDQFGINIKYIHKFLKSDKYDNFLSKIEWFVLPWSENRTNRVCGQMYDAIKQGCYIIAPDTNVFELVKKYNLGILYWPNTPEILSNILNKILTINIVPKLDKLVDNFNENKLKKIYLESIRKNE